MSYGILTGDVRDLNAMNDVMDRFDTTSFPPTFIHCPPSLHRLEIATVFPLSPGHGRHLFPRHSYAAAVASSDLRLRRVEPSTLVAYISLFYQEAIRARYTTQWRKCWIHSKATVHTTLQIVG